MPNLKFLASTVPDILGGPKIPKADNVPHMTDFDLILYISLMLINKCKNAFYTNVNGEIVKNSKIQKKDVTPK